MLQLTRRGSAPTGDSATRITGIALGPIFPPRAADLCACGQKFPPEFLLFAYRHQKYHQGNIPWVALFVYCAFSHVFRSTHHCQSPHQDAKKICHRRLHSIHWKPHRACQEEASSLGSKWSKLQGYRSCNTVVGGNSPRDGPGATWVRHTLPAKSFEYFEAQWKHSYLTFWFAGNGLAPTTTKYCHFNAFLIHSVRS